MDSLAAKKEQRKGLEIWLCLAQHDLKWDTGALD
jgi:hypothetical protein